jgi:hypothetical protein
MMGAKEFLSPEKVSRSLNNWTKLIILRVLDLSLHAFLSDESTP